MRKRKVPINIDKELESKIYKLQADLIAATKKKLTYSTVIDIILEVGLKNLKIKSKEKS